MNNSKKKAGFTAYLTTPVMSALGMTLASLIFIFVLKESSPVPVFIILGSINFITMTLYALLPGRGKEIARHISLFLNGLFILVLAGLLGRQNFQIEGLFFYTLSGLFGGVTVHFIMAKVIGPIIYGRNWCSWGCWTVMLLDLLPFKKNNGWVKGGRTYKVVYFIAALAITALLTFLFGYTIQTPESVAGGMGTVRELYWFVTGTVLYYLIGITLAIILKDNRAFCKYICPVSLLAGVGARVSLLKIKGDKESCNSCGVCTKNCLMSIDIPAYVKAGERVKSSECVMCMKCIATCPEAALKSAVGLDLGIKDRHK